jgi:hypothetical protein
MELVTPRPDVRSIMACAAPVRHVDKLSRPRGGHGGPFPIHQSSVMNMNRDRPHLNRMVDVAFVSDARHQDCHTAYGQHNLLWQWHCVPVSAQGHSQTMRAFNGLFSLWHMIQPSIQASCSTDLLEF